MPRQFAAAGALDLQGKPDYNKQKRSLANASDLVSMLQKRYPTKGLDTAAVLVMMDGVLKTGAHATRHLTLCSARDYLLKNG